MSKYGSVLPGKKFCNPKTEKCYAVNAPYCDKHMYYNACHDIVARNLEENEVGRTEIESALNDSHVQWLEKNTEDSNILTHYAKALKEKYYIIKKEPII